MSDPCNFKYNITTSQLVRGTTLEDGDVIWMEEGPSPSPTPPPPPAPPYRPMIAFTLQTPIKVTWWKGLLLFTPECDGHHMVLAQTEDNTHISTSYIPFDWLKQNVLVFSKAKFLGIHTSMYCVTDAATRFEANKYYIFEWEKD